MTFRLKLLRNSINRAPARPPATAEFRIIIHRQKKGVILFNFIQNYLYLQSGVLLNLIWGIPLWIFKEVQKRGEIVFWNSS